MSQTRYVISVDCTGDQGEHGPVICSPSGGVILYYSSEDAGLAARACVKGGTVKDAYVHKLVPVACYMGTVPHPVTGERAVIDVVEEGPAKPDHGGN